MGIWTNVCEAPRTGMAGEKSGKERGKHAKPRKGGTGGATDQSWECYRGSSEVIVKVWMGRKI